MSLAHPSPAKKRTEGYSRTLWGSAQLPLPLPPQPPLLLLLFQWWPAIVSMQGPDRLALRLFKEKLETWMLAEAAAACTTMQDTDKPALALALSLERARAGLLLLPELCTATGLHDNDCSEHWRVPGQSEMGLSASCTAVHVGGGLHHHPWRAGSPAFLGKTVRASLSVACTEAKTAHDCRGKVGGRQGVEGRGAARAEPCKLWLEPAGYGSEGHSQKWLARSS